MLSSVVLPMLTSVSSLLLTGSSLDDSEEEKLPGSMKRLLKDEHKLLEQELADNTRRWCCRNVAERQLKSI
jgi:hypothetical protein